MREGGGDCVKYLKRGWNRKEGRGNKNFKEGGGELGQGVGALKRGDRNPLKNYGSLCVTLDVYTLNKAVISTSCPFPKQEDIKVQLSVSEIFSKLDFKSAFWN